MEAFLEHTSAPGVDIEATNPPGISILGQRLLLWANCERACKDVEPPSVR